MSTWVEKQRREQQIAEKMALLSLREREVLELLVLGRKTTQIASALSISASTVEKHRLRIFEKTGVDSVVDLINWLR
jgi:two-component system response regulator DctR